MTHLHRPRICTPYRPEPQQHTNHPRPHSRWPSTILLGLFAIVASLTFNGYPLKIAIIACLIQTLIELYAALCKVPGSNTPVIEIQIGIIYGALFGIAILPPTFTILVVAGAWFSDTFAYVTGKLFGHRLWKRQPFPELSPNKTYEGVLGAFIFTPIAILATYYLALGTPPSHLTPIDAWFVGTSSIFAMLGDLIGSCTKRTVGVKDSCEMVASYRFLQFLERPMGGRHGQGGYLDRFDSVSLLAIVTLCVLVISSLLLGLTA